MKLGSVSVQSKRDKGVLIKFWLPESPKNISEKADIKKLMTF